MSNVLPVQEQKRVWGAYRQRFISLISIAFSILAVIMILTLSPSYVLIMLNHPPTSVIKVQTADSNDRVDAGKTAMLIQTLLPIVAATSSTMQLISEALDGRQEGIAIDRISYTVDAKQQQTLVLGGTAPARESINAFRKELEAKGKYKSVTVPVGDLIGASGNSFTVTIAI